MIDYKSIGRRISIYRKKKGLTQAAFSEALNVSESYISQIERGKAKASLSRLDEIANILEVDITLLLSDNVVLSDIPVNLEVCEIIQDWSKPQINFLINQLLCADEQFKNNQRQ